jgi:hypothetical protein
MPRRDKESVSLELLLENKKEYMQHLYQLLTEPVYAEIYALYQTAQKTAADDKILEAFQEQLTKIPHWNADQVLALKERVSLRMKCDYFHDLVKATFMVFLRLHLATLAESPANLKVKMPAIETYIHRIVVATARMLWKKPYILYHKVRTLEKQKNLLQCEAFIHKAIHQTIQSSLPLNEIFRHVSQVNLTEPKQAASSEESASSSEPEESSGASDADASETDASESESVDSRDASETDVSESNAEESESVEASSDTEGSESVESSEEASDTEEPSIVSQPKEETKVIENSVSFASFAIKENSVSAAGFADSPGFATKEDSANIVSPTIQPEEEPVVSDSEINLIKAVEITPKESTKKLHRPVVRPIVSKLQSSRPSNAFF